MKMTEGKKCLVPCLCDTCLAARDAELSRVRKDLISKTKVLKVIDNYEEKPCAVGRCPKCLKELKKRVEAI